MFPKLFVGSYAFYLDVWFYQWANISEQYCKQVIHLGAPRSVWWVQAAWQNGISNMSTSPLVGLLAGDGGEGTLALCPLLCFPLYDLISQRHWERKSPGPWLRWALVAPFPLLHGRWRREQGQPGSCSVLLTSHVYWRKCPSLCITPPNASKQGIRIRSSQFL